MATKFYFHRGTTAVTGTLPAGSASVSASTPAQIATGGGTNRIMDSTISVIAQTTGALTTLANTSAQASLILRFISPLLAAQTIASQSMIASLAGLTSNANSNFSAGLVVVTWRPSDGSKQVLIDDVSGASWPLSFNTTSQTATTGSLSSITRTIVNGDVIVAEVWRLAPVQSMSTAYTNTIAYDGTTEASTTNEAGFLSFANTISLYTPSKSFPNQSRTNRNTLLRRCIGRAWDKRPSGIFVPEYAGYTI